MHGRKNIKLNKVKFKSNYRYIDIICSLQFSVNRKEQMDKQRNKRRLEREGNKK